jgi:DNA end-binding protein Ku
MASARSIWSGSISFGLVNIPIRVHTAVREKTVSFNLLHDQDKVKLQRKMVCPADGKEVHPEHWVKGYPIGKDEYVVVQDSEIDACAPKSSRTIEITDFVDLDEIDPIFYARTYYTSPDPRASKAYRLLLDAMRKTNRVGIAKVVMHRKEHVVALRPMEDTIALTQMYFGDEVVPVSEVGGLPGPSKVAEREMAAATQLIESLVMKFDPGKYKDEYRLCIEDLVQKKAAGERIIRKPQEPARTGRAMDLMAALEASLKKARAGAGPDGPPNKPRRRKARTAE